MPNKGHQGEGDGESEQIIRHQQRDRENEPSPGDEELIDALADHVEKHIAPIEYVMHEILSDLVHVDVHCLKTSEELPARILVTSGMAERPMTLPEGYPFPPYLELCIALPPDWRLSAEEGESEEEAERWYWPIRWLKILARLPHEYETFLGEGHTVPHGDPPEPYSDDSPFVCVMLVQPYFLEPEHAEFRAGTREVQILQVAPLFPEEVELKLREGAEAVLERWEQLEIHPFDYFNPGRPNAGLA